MDKMEPFGRVFFKSSLINLRFAQMQGFVFVQRSIALVFSNVIRQLTLSRLISPKMRSVINYSPSCVSSLKRRIMSGSWALNSVTSNCICCRHCQSVLSWQAILLDAVPSAFRLRSLRRGRGGLSFAWQLFSCRFISMGMHWGYLEIFWDILNFYVAG